MNYIIDILIVLIIGLCTFIGYKRGLIKVAVNILGFFLAIIIAFVLYEPVSNIIIKNTPLKDNIKNSISDTIEGYVTNSENEIEEETEDKEENSEINNEKRNESRIISNHINKFVEEEKQKLENTTKQIVENVSETVAINIIKVFSAILVFIISKIILLVIKIFADEIGKIPLIKQFNEAGGLIYGILQGFLIIYITLAVISLISPSLNNSVLLSAINNSIIGRYLYNNNLILKILFRN